MAARLGRRRGKGLHPARQSEPALDDEGGLGRALLPDIFATRVPSSEALRQLFPEIAPERSDDALIHPMSAEPCGSAELFSAWLRQGPDLTAVP